MNPADSVLIIGAGLTGLSCAYHLGGGRLLEREENVGGLCRSYNREGFTFDFTGHLLHLKDPYLRELISKLAPDMFVPHLRRARIYSQGRLTGYPFQANLWGLPPEVIDECLEGLKKAEDLRTATTAPDNFDRWIVHAFGEGITRHFMAPYNRKLWRVPLEELTTEWVSGMIPVPRLEDTLKGAHSPDGVNMGYNVRFLYPKEGGISCLPQLFASHVPRIHLKREVVQIDTKIKKVYCRDGGSFHYDILVSTMPLPALVRMIKTPSAEVARAVETLRHVSVYDLNIGIRRDRVSDAHWIYFPEKEYIFYRVGFPGNFSPVMVPDGMSSAYVEVSHLPQERVGTDELTGRSLQGLKDCGLCREDDDIHLTDLVHIPYAYVIFDRQRKNFLPGIQKYLEEMDIFSVGRYGSWGYFSMEDAMLTGRATAMTIRKFYG